MKLHHVDHRGAGTPLLLLHGGSAHAHWWDFVAPLLLDSHRVLALDLRGHGDSEWSPDGAYGLGDYAGDVAEWIAARGLERPAVVGHSLGSFVALRYALDHPGGLRALVVVDGRASFGPAGSRRMRLLRALAPAHYPTLEEAVERFQPLPRETIAAPEVLEYVARRSFRPDGKGRWVTKFDPAVLGAHEPFDFRERLGELRAPVLFVRGERSPILSSAAARELAAACRRGSWREIPDAYHHVLLDRPAELGAVLREFLAAEG